MTDLTPSNGDHRAPVVINNVPVTPIVVRDQRVLAFAQIDKIHGRTDGTASRNFRENRERLTEGEDYFVLTADEIRLQSLSDVFPPRTPKGTLVTESGYLMLVKSLTDDLAWQVQKELVKAYFRATAPAPQLPDFTDPVIAARAWADEVEAKRRAEAHARALTQQLETDAPYTEIARAITGQATMTRRDWCALMKTDHGLGLRETELTAWLFEQGYLYRDQLSREVRAYAQHASLFKLEVHVINGFARKVLMMTGDGVLQLTPLVVKAFRTARPLDPPHGAMIGSASTGGAQ